MALPSTAEDYRTRFKIIQTLENERGLLFEEALEQLNAVTLQLANVMAEKKREISILTADLEDQREGRRREQDKAANFKKQLITMEQARFVLVLIDADADIYMFNEFLSRGLEGGQAAADLFMEKVREHLSYMGSSISDAKNVPVVIKAYANMGGLAQACVRDRKLNSASEMAQFWIGFSRRYPHVDFVDVGAGKEEADNKIREVLSFHVANPQCEHVLLACCHDAGYVPVLRQYAAQASQVERITLVSSGVVRSDLLSLGFRTTSIFEPLFMSSPAILLVQPVNGQKPPSPATVQKQVDLITASRSNSGPKPVKNSGRLRPIIRDKTGKRIDKNLNVDASISQAIRKRNLCVWHYLRADCQEGKCKREHGYPRPLSPAEYDALWYFARQQGRCFKLSKKGDCEDDQCFYGHG